MNTNVDTVKNRETWCDAARGICSLTVILAHIPAVPDAVVMYFSPFTVPCFFILAGYFTKNYGGSIPDFLYNKVLRELLLKLMFCFSLTTLSLQIIAGLLLHPSTIPEWLYDTSMSFLVKPTAYFFSVLVLCSLYFMIVNKLCRDKPHPMMLAGVALMVVGFLLARERIIRPWNWDTALVCVFFYIAGYCARQTGIIAKFKFRPEHAILSGCAFFALVTVFACTLGVTNARIIVANNTFLSPLVSVPLLIAGNGFVIALGNVLPKENRPVRLLMYIGRHSMLYFMIGGPVLAYVNYFNTLLFEAVHWRFLESIYFKIPVYIVLTAGLTLIPAYLSDRFCPALNGRFRLPEDLVRRRPKTCMAVCVVLPLIGACFVIATLKGMIIPNKIYARHYSVQGVDVSSYQGKINWKTLESQGVRFAFIKATEGSGHVDSRFAENWRAVSGTDIAAGAYHFFSFESSGRTQAQHFIATVPVRDNSLPPVIDLEYYGDHERHPLPADLIVPELQCLLDTLEKHYGKRPIIYVTEPSYLQYVYSYFDDYPIWFRNVVTDPPEGNWLFWQYTNRAKLEGYRGKESFIDMNAFLGSEEEWRAFIHNQPAP